MKNNTTKRIEDLLSEIELETQNGECFSLKHALTEDYCIKQLADILATHLHQKVISSNEILINELKKCISLCENCGDFSNGVEAFGVDEGIVNATQIIKNAKRCITDLERQIKEDKTVRQCKKCGATTKEKSLHVAVVGVICGIEGKDVLIKNRMQELPFVMEKNKNWPDGQDNLFLNAAAGIDITDGTVLPVLFKEEQVITYEGSVEAFI